MTDEQLIQIAKDYILEKHPEWKKDLSYPVKVRNSEEYWHINFEFPEGMMVLGDTPSIMIDKKTKKVVWAHKGD